MICTAQLLRLQSQDRMKKIKRKRDKRDSLFYLASNLLMWISQVTETSSETSMKMRSKRLSNRIIKIIQMNKKGT